MKKKKREKKTHSEKTGLGQTVVFELWNIKDNYQCHTNLTLSWLSQKVSFF